MLTEGTLFLQEDFAIVVLLFPTFLYSWKFCQGESITFIIKNQSINVTINILNKGVHMDLHSIRKKTGLSIFLPFP